LKLLLDTHALLWFIDGDKRFSEEAKSALGEDEAEIFVSVASIWEIAIKTSLGKLRLRLGIERELGEFLDKNGFRLTEIEYSHAAHVASLPFGHKDPFDRLLVAQALIEGMTILSHDVALDSYDGVTRIW
jgi:PIN domain nuclease of toxin-antitoxin system